MGTLSRIPPTGSPADDRDRLDVRLSRHQLHGLADAYADAKGQKNLEMILIPCLEDIVHNNVNGGTFGGGVIVCVDDVSILDNVPEVCFQSHKQAKTVLFHAGSIGVSNLGAHTDELFAIHACARFVFALTVMAIVPYRADNVGVGGDGFSGVRVTIHSIILVLIQLGKFGLDDVASGSLAITTSSGKCVHATTKCADATQVRGEDR
jgi:hypothetical protein